MLAPSKTAPSGSDRVTCNYAGLHVQVREPWACGASTAKHQEVICIVPLGGNPFLGMWISRPVDLKEPNQFTEAQWIADLEVNRPAFLSAGVPYQVQERRYKSVWTCYAKRPAKGLSGVVREDGFIVSRRHYSWFVRLYPKGGTASTQTMKEQLDQIPNTIGLGDDE